LRVPRKSLPPLANPAYHGHMADETLILEILKRIQADVSDLRRDFDLMRVRMSAFEDHMRGVITTLGGIQADLDQLNTRVGRIERRLDIVDA
jgi:hypothetical protein